MSRIFRLAIAGLLATAASFGAHATTTAITQYNQWYAFDIDDLTSQSFGTEWIDFSDGTPLTFTFTINSGSVGLLTVLDTIYAGDTFKVYNGATLLGSTSSVPIGVYPGVPGIFDPDVALFDASFSRATFVLGAGGYSISGVLDQSVLLDMGGPPLSSTSGDVRLTVSPIPEPEAFSMLIAGLGLIRVFTRRRRGTQDHTA